MALRLFQLTRIGRHRDFPLWLGSLHRAHASTRKNGFIGQNSWHEKQSRTGSATRTPAIFQQQPSPFDQESANTLSFSEKDQIFLARLGPLSPQDMEVQQRLLNPGCNPTEILRQSIVSGSASVHVVRLCLEAQYREIEQVPRKHRRKMALAQDNIASTSLDFILRDPSLWGAFALYCFRAQFVLSFYAIIRGLESRLVDLTCTELKTDQLRPQQVWRGVLLRTIIAAHCLLDSRGDKGPAIRCFLDMLAKRRAETARHQRALTRDESASKPSILYLNLTPARVELNRVLGQGECHNTSPILIDQLVREYSAADTFSVKLQQKDRDYDIASMLLSYPGYPKDTAALEMLRRFAAGDSEAFPDRITTPKGQEYFKQFLQRTVDVLLFNDNAIDAEWVKQKFQVLLDPVTGNFATPTRIRKPDNFADKPRRDNRTTKKPVERVSSPTFT